MEVERGRRDGIPHAYAMLLASRAGRPGTALKSTLAFAKCLVHTAEYVHRHAVLAYSPPLEFRGEYSLQGLVGLERL